MINDIVTKNTWDRFVREGVLDTSRMRKLISESWYRSKSVGVNPYGSECKTILVGDLFVREQQKSKVLMDIAKPFIDDLCSIIEGSGSIVILNDSSGCVLDINGDSNTIQLAKKSKIVQGALWKEDEVGTNAIATSLYTGEALSVHGSEHYSTTFHQWGCAAAPIHNEEGTVIGALNVSTPTQHYHPHTLGLIVSMVYGIQQQLKIFEQNNYIELLQSSIDWVKGTGLVAVCTPKDDVALISTELKSSVSQNFMVKVNHILQQGYQELCRTPIYSKNHGIMIGYCVYFAVAGSKQSSNQKQLTTGFTFRGEAGTSQIFKRTLREIESVALTETTIHLSGETGTGKEILARTIHDNSLRKDGPFVAVNCGAIAPQLIEAELFGYVEGAFTGAHRKGRKGKFEQANGGTLFLDEIGEIPPAIQVALLRVLQEREVTPVGSEKVVPVNFKLITATHKDLKELVRKGVFREDLFYRLHVYPITVPALRERKEDIPHLIRHFCQKNNWSIQLQADHIKKLMQYQWPGNIRELVNFLERMLIMFREEAPRDLDIASLLGLSESQSPFTDQETYTDQENFSDDETLTYSKRIQKEKMIWALEQTGGNISKSAQLLNLPRSTFYRRMNCFKLN